METRTIDDLLSDLMKRINFANPEEMRSDVMDYVRRCFVEEIGIDFVAYPFTEKMQIVAHILKVPSYVLKVDDLSEDNIVWNAYQVERAMQTTARLAFTKSPYGYRFDNINRGDVWVKGLGLPRDQNGDAVIPMDAYAAVLRFCLGLLLEDQFTHPRYGERFAIQQNAKDLCAKARIALAQSGSTAQDRTWRHSTGHIRTSRDYTSWTNS